ncbi:MAG: MG2 domain-containing protein [Steroidobacteraceae bacterium]|nr:MG2 domain-containing protein [Steroidobacteraceae bacterium]
MRRVLPLALLSAVGLSIATAAPPSRPGPLAVASFSPAADARGAAQAVLRFDRPVVRFGDARAAAPAAVQCPVPGEGRWLDERTWSYDFATPLPAGLRCSVTLDRRLRALDGTRLAQATSYAIDSGGPAIARSAPAAGETIDEQQVFALLADGDVDPVSIGEHARCEADGVGESIPVRVLDGASRESALAALGAERWRLAVLTNPEAPWQGPKTAVLAKVLVVACARRLPNDAAARLVWGRGIRSTAGVVRTDEQVLEFRTRPAFVARLSCERLVPDGDCLPVTPIRVEFTAPVPRADAARVRLVDAASGRAFVAKEGEAAEPLVEYLVFAPPFPANAKLRLEVPADLEDDAGRRLANAARFPLAVPIAAAPPLAKFAASFGVLERRAQPALPVTLRNLDAPGAKTPQPVPGRVVSVTDDAQILAWLGRLDAAWDARKPVLGPQDAARAIAVPRSTREAEVVGIPLPAPGLHVVELASPTLGAALTGERDRTWYVRSAALVTNLSVHVKTAPERSLVWVTTLDTARPVADANVTVRACDGTSLWTGRTDARGLAFTGPLPLENGDRRCRGVRGLYVSARTADDLAFALTDWDEGIAPWAFDLPFGGQDATNAALHAVLDRTLLRAGETVHMKHYARRRTGAGFAALPARELPEAVTVTHVGTGQEWRLPLQFQRGAALSSFEVPRDAKLGDYRLAYVRADRWLGLAGEFAVEEFRLPTQRATLQLERGPLVAPARVMADAAVTFLAGGGAAGAPVTLRWRTEAASPRPAGYDDYTFAAEPIRVGVGRADVDGEGDLVEEAGEGDAGAEVAAGPSANVRALPLVLDAQGGVRATLEGLGPLGRPASLVAELEYPDANGQRLSVSTRATLYPAALQVGLRSPRWPRAGERFEVGAVVVDLAGRPLAGRRVVVEAYSRTIYSYRKRLFGGFYGYENRAEVKSLGRLCEATTDARGRVRCEAELPGGHQVLLRASAQDDLGRTADATDSLWLADQDAWWGGTDSERMDLVPERRRYEVGETARLEARVPFRASTALVTVEREGVLDAQVVPLAARSPNVSVAVRRGWSPNVYVSVLAVRGRVGDPAPTALVDLAKPTFRVGYAQLEIGRAPHELRVDVGADRAVYPTRGTARVTVAARRPDGTPAANAEVALAAVDEALLELAPNDTVDLLGAMLAPRPLQVRTATAHLQVIGKRHYGRKAAPPGGGGGRSTTRELFDTLLKWQGRVALDAAGRASVEVPLNDSLSSFRITAVGAQGDDLFGTGSTTVRTHRDLMLFAGVPEVARVGDVPRATVTLRNAAERALDVAVDGSVVPVTADGRRLAAIALPARPVALAAGASQELAWPVTVPPEAARLEWRVEARAPGVPADAVRVVSRVLPGRAEPAVQQATLLRLDAPRRLTVERPRDAVPGLGEVRVALASTLVGGLAGVRAYLDGYAYTCLEQRASRAIGLGDAGLWAAVTNDLPAYLDGDGLARFFATQERGSDVLTAYLLSIAQADGREIPAEARDRMLGALSAFVEGRLASRDQRRAGELTVRRLAAYEALARHGRLEPAMLEPLSVQPELWPTSALLHWIATLEHARALPDREARLADARALLRSRLAFAGSRVALSGERDAAFGWLLDSADTDAVRTLLLALDAPDFRDDLPRLASGALGRQRRGHWDTTPANAWGTVAVRRFAARFETANVGGTTQATLGAARAAHAWTAAAPTPATGSTAGPARDGTPIADGTLALPWPDARGASLVLEHAGTGAPWATVQSVAAVPLTRPVAAGYRVVRRVEPVQVATPGVLSRGDLLRVVLEVEARQDMAWVALTDPVPAGATILGGTARTASTLATADAAPPRRGEPATAYPTFVERGFAGWRAYFEFLPRGTWRVEYMLRLNAAGEFVLPPTRVEAMYAPDLYGAAPNPAVVVRPAP